MQFNIYLSGKIREDHVKIVPNASRYYFTFLHLSLLFVTIDIKSINFVTNLCYPLKNLTEEDKWSEGMNNL